MRTERREREGAERGSHLEGGELDERLDGLGERFAALRDLLPAASEAGQAGCERQDRRRISSSSMLSRNVRPVTLSCARLTPLCRLPFHTHPIVTLPNRFHRIPTQT